MQRAAEAVASAAESVKEAGGEGVRLWLQRAGMVAAGRHAKRLNDHSARRVPDGPRPDLLDTRTPHNLTISYLYIIAYKNIY